MKSRLMNKMRITNRCTMMEVLSIVLLMTGMTAFTLSAQDTTYSRGDATDRLGASVSGAVNAISTDIKGLDGVPSCCPDYKTGDGLSFRGAAEYQSVFGKRLSVGGRVGFGIFNGTLLANESKKMINAGVEENVTIEHRIAMSVSDIIVAPFIEYSIIDRLPVQIGITMQTQLSATFTQAETILSPSTVVYENNRRDRLNASGDIPSFRATRFDLTAGIGYTLPLSPDGEWKLAPRLEVALPLGSLIATGTVNITSFGIGVSFYREYYHRDMTIMPAAAPPPPPPVPTPKPKPEPRLLASVSLRMKEDGQKEFNLTLKSKATNTAFPLLPYIFFDDSSAVLAPRYKRLTADEARNFTYLALDNLPDLDRYSHILNIIGKRLNEFPATSITLVGCNSNTESELNNKQLSIGRAQTIKDYLTSVWKIDTKRITLEARNLPSQFSNPKTDDGKEENRRVEIIPSNTDLYVPVFLNDTSFTASQPNFYVVPDIIAEAGVKDWSVQFMQGGKVLWKASGTGMPPKTLSIPMNDSTAPRYGKDLQILLDVTDTRGKHVSATDVLGVSVVQDTSVERKQFTLVLFDFNSSELTTLNKRVVSMIKDQIKSNSKVSIVGFADRSGNLDYNKKLALRRGGTLAQSLNHKNADVSAFDGKLLINNDLPEGRYFCRTVRLLIEDKR
ncbi:MAG: OmpA family protein [Ignavibacteria bacterium]|nr:OmpA family protein [Ignavibacteria bacterium]